MFGRIKSKISRLFRVKSSRRIFAYHDGSRWRSIDPIEVLHGIASHPTYLAGKHLDLVRAGDQESMEITAQAVCDIFDVKPYAGSGRRTSGLTIGERIALMDAFNDYCYWVKKNIKSGATPALSTG